MVVLTPRLRVVRRAALRAALIADLVLAMVVRKIELVKDSNASRRVKGFVGWEVGQFKFNSLKQRPFGTARA